MVLVNIPERRIELVGIDGQRTGMPEIEAALAERRVRWTPPTIRHAGVLDQYTRLARPSLEGGSSSSGRR